MSKDDDWIHNVLARPERDAELAATGQDIPLFPLAGISTATLPEDNVMLALEVLTPPPEMGARILRIAVKRSQCAELAKLLERLSRIPHILPPDKPN